nr:AMP-dependent synthetase [Rhodoferax sp.]
FAWRQQAIHGDRWTALPGIDWRLDEDVLSVRSAHLPDDNWFQTSDRARLTGDGGFVLMGRADRIAKIEEKRISLTAVEAALYTTGLIQEARAMAMPHAGSARLVVVGVPTPQGWALMRDSGRRHYTDVLRNRLGDLLERVALPRRWRFVRTLPVNSQGKTTESMLQDLFGADMPPPQWLRRGETEAVAELTVSPDLDVLQGHFPGFPLLPGIAQVDWAIALARQCFALTGEFRSLEGLKFHRPVTPGMRVQVHLEWQAPTGRLGFRYSSFEGAHSSGRVTFSSTHV